MSEILGEIITGIVTFLLTGGLGSIFYFNVDGSFSGPCGYIARTDIGNTTESVANGYTYFKFASFDITGEQAAANTTTNYVFYYDLKIKNVAKIYSRCFIKK